MSESSGDKTAYQVALQRLASREMSLSELESSLTRKGFGSAEIQAALRRVVELGYLNEERLALALIRDTRLARRGPRAAWLKLKKKGILGWTLERVIAEWRDSGADPELEVARAWVMRRYPGFENDPKKAQRALGALVRRGFSFEQAKKALSLPETD